MAAARKPAAKSGKVVQVTPLSYRGEPIPQDADLRDVLPPEVLEQALERGEAKHV